MVHIHGKRMFGTCDVVPEVFHVGTLFVHVDFLPLVPVGSYIVLGRQGQQRVKIPLQLRSVLLTWARVATLAVMVVAAAMTVTFAVDRPGQRNDAMIFSEGVTTAVSALIFILLMVVPRRKKPRYGRACKLAHLAQLTEKGWAAMNVQYGRDVADRGPEGVLAVRDASV